METTNTIITGLQVNGQVHLNTKEYKLNEATLMDLGLNDNLAYKYPKGLRVHCITERTNWEWKEMEAGDVGLLPSNFTYPNGLIVDGIDYSNTQYNFVSIDYVAPGLQEVVDVGKIAKYENSIVELLTGSPNNRSIYMSVVQTFDLYTELEMDNDSIFLRGYDSTGESSYISAFSISNGRISIATNKDQGLNTVIDIADPVAETNIRFPAKLANGTYIIATLDDIPIITGNETKIIDGSNSTVTGNGTITTPYQINVPIPTGAETKINSGTNVTVSGTGTTGNPYVINSFVSIINGTNTTVTGAGTSVSPYQIAVPTPTGAETKVNGGSNITVTGAGTTASPYVVNAVIPASTGVQSQIMYLPTWAMDSQFAVAPPLFGKTIISAIAFLECTVDNNGFIIGDTVTTNVPEMGDSGGLGQQGIGVQWNNAAPTVMYINVADIVSIMGAYISTGHQGDPFVPNPAEWRIKVSILYI